MRLLAIWMLCPHPWTKMPPPPWELFVMPTASMLEGLHIKLLGYGLVMVVAHREVPRAGIGCNGSSQQRGAVREPSEQSRVVRIRGENHALREHGNGRSFERTHQGWLLQQFGQVAVEIGVPSGRGLEWQAIHLRAEFVGAGCVTFVVAVEVVPPRARARHRACGII